MRKKGLELQIKQLVHSLGKNFLIKPSNYLECVSICCTLHQSGIFTTAGKLSPSGDDPIRIIYEYQQMSDLLSKENSGNNFYLSLKPPALIYDLEYVASIASTAFKNNHAIHFDSHGDMDAGPTIQLLAQLIERFGVENNNEGEWRYGLSLPSRWKRSLSDGQWVIDNHIMPRIIKGEFKAEQAYDEMDPRAGFLELVDMLAGSVPLITLATHDYELAEEAIIRTKKTGTQIHMELLYGMPCAKLILLSKQEKIPLRFYVPYSDSLIMYGIYHLLTNPHKIFRPGLLELFASNKSKLAKIINTLN